MKVRSLSKHRYDIVNDNRMISIGIIGFPKTQINPSGSTSGNFLIPFLIKHIFLIQLTVQ